MPALHAEDLHIEYGCEFRGIAGPDHDAEDYPMFWTANVTALTDDEETIKVGDASFYVIPDAWDIDLFDTLDAIDGDLAALGEMLTTERPDIVPLGSDLLYLYSVRLEPQFRGQDLGHTILRAILSTVGRAVGLVALVSAPVLDGDAPEEGTPEHEAAMAALRRYWTRFGFTHAAGRYLVFVTEPL